MINIIMTDKRRHEPTSFSYQKKVLLLAFLDVLCIASSYFLGLWARFDFHFNSIGSTFIEHGIWFVLAVVFISLIIYIVLRLYHSVWRYASMPELYQIVSAYMVIGVFVVLSYAIPAIQMPRGALLMGYLLSFLSFPYVMSAGRNQYLTPAGN